MTCGLHLCTRHHSKVCSASLCASCVHVNGMCEVVPEAVLYTAPTVQISLCAVCACSSMWTCSQPGSLSLHVAGHMHQWLTPLLVSSPACHMLPTQNSLGSADSAVKTDKQIPRDCTCHTVAIVIAGCYLGLRKICLA